MANRCLICKRASNGFDCVLNNNSESMDKILQILKKYYTSDEKIKALFDETKKMKHFNSFKELVEFALYGVSKVNCIYVFDNKNWEMYDEKALKNFDENEDLMFEEIAKTTNGEDIEGEFSKDKKTFIDNNGEEHPVNDGGEVILEKIENPITLNDMYKFLNSLSLDTEYREAFASVLMEQGYIDDTPLNIMYSKNADKIKAYKDIMQKTLTKEQVNDFVIKMVDLMKDDYQFEDFTPFITKFTEEELEECFFESLNLNEDKSDYIKIGNRVIPINAMDYGYDSFDKITNDASKKLDMEIEAEKKAQEEKEILDKSIDLKNKVDDALENRPEDTKLEVLFDVLVPDRGACDTQAGELIRAINRVIYRDYNDGDKFYEGYGLETCASSIEYIYDTTDSKIRNKIDNIIDNAWALSDSSYTIEIEELSDLIVDYVLDNPILLGTKPKADSRNYKTTYIKEHQPMYTYEGSVPDALAHYVNIDYISDDDIAAEIEYNLYNYSVDNVQDVQIYVNREDIIISNLSKEAYDTIEAKLDDWLESYINQLDEEYEESEN